MMNIDSKAQFGLLVIAALSLGWTIGYYSRNDRIEALNTQLESYQKVDKLNLTELIKDISEVNSNISQNVLEINNYSKWTNQKKELTNSLLDRKKREKKLNEQISSTNNELIKTKALLKIKQTEIDALIPRNETFWLEENSTKSIAEFSITLGVNNVLPYSVEVILENKKHELRVGEFLETKYKDSVCRIILTEIVHLSSKSEFQVICMKPST